MEWLWLFLGIIGLGLLWLLIIGMDKLTDRLKENDEARRRTARDIAERTAKADAKDYIENADLSNQDDSALKQAIDTLSGDELVQSVAKRVLGAPQGTDGITATQSAFDQTPVHKVVAKGEGVMPVKVKSAEKSMLSKSEQKMLKKIKQGD